MTPAIKHSRKVTQLTRGDIIEAPGGLSRVRVTGVTLRGSRRDDIDDVVELTVEHLRGRKHGHGSYTFPAAERVWVYA